MGNKVFQILGGGLLLNNMNLEEFSLVIFDLDNTLYPENEFLFPAYKAIARLVSDKDGVNAADAENFLINNFLKEGRRNLFDRFISEFGLKNSGLNDFLKTLRSHKSETKIKLTPQLSKILEACIEKNIKVAVVTNGNPEQQRNKIDSIEWKGMLPELFIVYADETERKPSPKPLQIVLKKFETSGVNALFIGDDKVDESAANAAGIRFLHAQSADKLILG